MQSGHEEAREDKTPLLWCAVFQYLRSLLTFSPALDPLTRLVRDRVYLECYRAAGREEFLGYARLQEMDAEQVVCSREGQLELSTSMRIRAFFSPQEGPLGPLNTFTAMVAAPRHGNNADLFSLSLPVKLGQLQRREQSRHLVTEQAALRLRFWVDHFDESRPYHPHESPLVAINDEVLGSRGCSTIRDISTAGLGLTHPRSLALNPMQRGRQAVCKLQIQYFPEHLFHTFWYAGTIIFMEAMPERPCQRSGFRFTHRGVGEAGPTTGDTTPPIHWQRLDPRHGAEELAPYIGWFPRMDLPMGFTPPPR